VKAHVGIVDDHPSVVLGVTAALNAQPDLHVVAAGGTVTELLSHRIRLDVALLDLMLADGSAPAANIAQLAHHRIPVLVFTSGDRPDLVREASRAGAAGMIRKSEEPQVIADAVRTALDHGVVASADWAAAIDADPTFVSAELSEREAEVLTLYASGETAERVAELLFISKNTVLDHIQRIRAKYAAVSRPAPTKVDLYRRAVEDGLVPAES